MYRLVFYCKTYNGDYDRFQELIRTFHQFNRDGVVMYVSVPQSDIGRYSHFSCETLHVISDESFSEQYLVGSDLYGKMWEGKIKSGYANQQICKLTFYKTGVSHNYLCLDSDTIFIRDFYISDFMHSEDIPYTVMHTEKDLCVDRTYRQFAWFPWIEMVENVYAYMDLNDRRLRLCHCNQLMSSIVLDSLERDFMKPRSLCYKDLLSIAPHEFTWYTVWFQKCKLVQEYAVEPFFKVISFRQNYIFHRVQNLHESDFAHAYIGIILNSKWVPKTPLVYESPDVDYQDVYNALVKNEDVMHSLARFLRLRNVLKKNFLLSKFWKVSACIFDKWCRKFYYETIPSSCSECGGEEKKISRE